MAKPRWSEIQRKLAALPADDLRALVRALFYRSADNRRFLVARLLGAQRETHLEDDKRRIAEAFPSGEPPRRPRLGEARRIIREYRAASADLAGAADLMLTLLESATRFARDHIDAGDAYFAALAAVLDDLMRLLHDAPDQYPPFRKRLVSLAERSRGVGSSWGSDVEAALERLEHEISTS